MSFQHITHYKSEVFSKQQKSSSFTCETDFDCILIFTRFSFGSVNRQLNLYFFVPKNWQFIQREQKVLSSPNCDLLIFLSISQSSQNFIIKDYKPITFSTLPINHPLLGVFYNIHRLSTQTKRNS